MLNVSPQTHCSSSRGSPSLDGVCLPTQNASQVCALQWSRHEREILSSHGFSQNQLCLWKYPSMAKIAEFSVRIDPETKGDLKICCTESWHALLLAHDC